jgi:hypothetical protein
MTWDAPAKTVSLHPQNHRAAELNPRTENGKAPGALLPYLKGGMRGAFIGLDSEPSLTYNGES